MAAGLLAAVLLLSGCVVQAAAANHALTATEQAATTAAVQTGFTENQTLDGAERIVRQHLIAEAGRGTVR